MPSYKYSQELDFAKSISLIAGKMGLEFAKKQSLQVNLKSDYSSVTEADIALSEYLVKELKNQFPNDAIISEELPFNFFATTPHRAWTVDPIDGTKEFILGNGQWAVQIAFLVNGVPEFGVVYQAEKDILYFNDGDSSYKQVAENLTKMFVNTYSKDSSTLLISNSRMEALVYLSLEKKLFANTLKRGSIGLKAGAIADGEADLYMNSFRKCGIWDLAPCEPIIAKAGGLICTFDKGPIPYFKSEKGLVEVDFLMGSKKCVEDTAAQIELLNKELTSLNPSDFFRKGIHSDGSPRAVLTVGITGSGKSHWCKQAQSNDWQVVNTDELRKELLKNWADNGVHAVLNGENCVPDPNNPKHIFAPELREKVMEPDFLMGFLKKGKPLVLDINNLTLRRTEFIRRLRLDGYFVEALVFVPADPYVHNANLELRNSQNGIDIAPSGEADPKSYRLKIIKSLLANFESYCQNLREDSKYRTTKSLKPLPKLDFQKMADLQGPRAEIKKHLSQAEIEALNRIESEDIFNRVSYTQVGLFVYNGANKKV